ncbi:hypothetical protein Tco_1189017 [Tanacetum coccineum]
MLPSFTECTCSNSVDFKNQNIWQVCQGEINYTSHVADNIYKLPRLGVSGLAKEMGVPPEIVTDGVHTYFSQVSETRSTELCEIVKQHKRSQEAENEDEDSSTYGDGDKPQETLYEPLIDPKKSKENAAPIESA